VTPEQETQILEFLRDRARYVFREKDGYGYDEVNAIFRAGADDLVDARKRLDALRAIRKSKNFEPLTVSFKRIRKFWRSLEVRLRRACAHRFVRGDAERHVRCHAQSSAPSRRPEESGHYREALEVLHRSGRTSTGSSSR